MKKDLTKKAIQMLSQKNYSITKKRVEKLIRFLECYPKAKLVENNNWSYPPKVKSLKAYAHIGGTTFLYQIWAVV